MKNILSKMFSFFKKPGKPTVKRQKQIYIKYNNDIIGIIQSIDIDLSTKHPKIYISRAILPKTHIADVFGAIIANGTQRMPFEIEIKEFDSFNQTSITRLNNVWVVKMVASFLTGDLIIIESMNCEAENIDYTL